MHNRDSDKIPPPLPEEDEVNDNAKTVPANSAWEIVSEVAFRALEKQKNRDSNSLRQDKKEENLLSDKEKPRALPTQSEKPRELLVDAGKPLFKLKSSDKPEQRVLEVLPGVWTKPKVAIAAIISFLALAAYVIWNSVSEPSKQNAESLKQSPIEQQKTVILPSEGQASSGEQQRTVILPSEGEQQRTVILPTDDEVLSEEDRQEDVVLKQYIKEKGAIESTLIEIAGFADSSLLKFGKYQNLEALWRKISAQTAEKKSAAKNTGALFRNVQERLRGDLSSVEAGAVVPWDKLWKLGVTVFYTASFQIDRLEEIFIERPDLGVIADVKSYRKWLVEWLLGERGLYCQVRQRFWEQVKTGNPPIPKDEQRRIGKMRRERKQHLDKWGRREEHLYNYCDRNLFDAP
ncbi:MAG: hypothetical protein GY847_28080 [Proteobacteria bacterium]|nr:hypothetical protein [Pseudomonadota bacterium]